MQHEIKKSTMYYLRVLIFAQASIFAELKLLLEYHTEINCRLKYYLYLLRKIMLRCFYFLDIFNG